MLLEVTLHTKKNKKKSVKMLDSTWLFEKENDTQKKRIIYLTENKMERALSSKYIYNGWRKNI